MPIANCIISAKCQASLENTNNLIQLWSDEAKISPQHMTINIIKSSVQLGNEYQVMVTLLLPSIWSKPDISSLQVGLANALKIHFNIPINEVFISTSIINSGMVVEAGKEVTW